jgi:hypothetical protein
MDIFTTVSQKYLLILLAFWGIMIAINLLKNKRK